MAPENETAVGAEPAVPGSAPGGASPPDLLPKGESLLRLEGIGKSFGSVRALMDINLDIPAGLVTALVGDNGAGKSTMIKAISGISEPNEGAFYWKGQPVHIRHPKDATELGIATVYQDLALADNLDIVQNVFLGRELRKHFLLDEGAMEHRAKQALADLSVVTVRSIRQLVGSLSGGQRQAVAVARSVMQNAQLVIMDEPTAALGVTQTAMVIDLIKQLAARGVAVLVVSHNLTDVFAMADRIGVLYLGHIAGVGNTSDLDLQEVLELITTGGATHGA
ncbi:MAG TPA: ATP-binding cassette domain-containing protein [Acidimicrobiales bacterium]|nr:ATP-binding cassette domain-containing protein [Acidimicrobiales bacterium]